MKKLARHTKTSKTAHGTTTQLPAWQSKWPVNGDLKVWMRCMLEKCDAIVDVEDGASAAHLPIEQLHELGHTKDALKSIAGFLKRLPRDSNLETVRMHELAAEIHLSVGNVVAMEK
ncbi:MAG: hypothetical protein KDA85_04160, partial [Planctomycetaceae bacterium]|nr:hypothetical protein [Planctomycetaceae bacterium]